MGRPWCGCACGPVVLRCLVAHPLMGRHGGRRGRWVGSAVAVCPRRRCASWRVFPIPVCRAAGGRRPAVGPSPTIIYICIGVVNSALRGTLGPCSVAADGCFGGRCPAFCRYCNASGREQPINTWGFWGVKELGSKGVKTIVFDCLPATLYQCSQRFHVSKAIVCTPVSCLPPPK